MVGFTKTDHRSDSAPVETCMRPLPKEPDDGDRKKKTLKSKIKGSSSKPSSDSKPNISYPTNFEHTVHVGFDAVTGEFTVSTLYLPQILNLSIFYAKKNIAFVNIFSSLDKTPIFIYFC